jgi:hypothetical protein
VAPQETGGTLGCTDGYVALVGEPVTGRPIVIRLTHDDVTLQGVHSIREKTSGLTSLDQ